MINTDDETLKLCDFGFARVLPTKPTAELTDYVATRWYRSPELLLGTNYGKEVDYWAIGCIMGEIIDGDPLFPGENEIDQLFLIKKNLGPLTSDQEEDFRKNPRYIGLKFPDVPQPETLDKRYGTKLNKQGLSLMNGLLKMDPHERFTGIDALAHPYFDGIRDQECEDMVESKKA